MTIVKECNKGQNDKFTQDDNGFLKSSVISKDKHVMETQKDKNASSNANIRVSDKNSGETYGSVLIATSGLNTETSNIQTNWETKMEKVVTEIACFKNELKTELKNELAELKRWTEDKTELDFLKNELTIIKRDQSVENIALKSELGSLKRQFFQWKASETNKN